MRWANKWSSISVLIRMWGNRHSYMFGGSIKWYNLLWEELFTFKNAGAQCLAILLLETDPVCRLAVISENICTRVLTAALFLEWKQMSIKKLHYGISTRMMEVSAVSQKNEVDLSVLVCIYLQDEKASCRIYCTIPLALTKRVCTRKCLCNIFP